MQEPVPKLESDSDFKPIDWKTVIDKITEIDTWIQKENLFFSLTRGRICRLNFMTL